MTKAKKSAPSATQFGEPLTLTITIPAKVVPLFSAMAALKIAQHQPTVRRAWKAGKLIVTGRGPRMTVNDVATHAVMRWVYSDEAMNCINSAVNALMASED